MSDTRPTCTWIPHTYTYAKNPHWQKGCGYTAAMDDPYTPICGHCHKPVQMIGHTIRRTGAMKWRKTSEELPPAGVQVYVLMRFGSVCVLGMYNGLFPHEPEDYGELNDLSRWWRILDDGSFGQLHQPPDWWMEVMEPE